MNSPAPRAVWADKTAPAPATALAAFVCVPALVLASAPYAVVLYASTAGAPTISAPRQGFWHHHAPSLTQNLTP